MIFISGSRVQISVDHHWAKGASGTIADYPDYCLELLGGERVICGCWSLVNTTSGQKKFYWIVFDRPQNDNDGDGPYSASEFPENELSSQE